jgi:hypothetical protein
MTVRTPIFRKAAILAREGTSCGAYSWCKPWRARKAIGIGLPVEGDGWWRIEIGLDGLPHGVSTSKVATCSK